MATRTRGNTNVPARRTPPPSHLPQTGTVQHPRPQHSSSKMNSSAQKQDSTSSQKQIPTYLKSTNVSKQQSKRPSPGDTAYKATLTRRSTFDDHSSPSTTQNPTPLPSTFSSKTATTQKTGPAQKPSSLYTRPVSSGKKEFIYVKKQDIGTSAQKKKERLRSPTKKVEVSNAYDFPQPEQNPKDQGSSINEAKEEAVQVGSRNEIKADVLAQEDPISNAQTKAENGKDVNVKQDITLVFTIEQATEDVSQVVETVSNIDQEYVDEISSSKTDENVDDSPTSEVEEMNKEPEKTVVSDKNEAVGTESEVAESKETEAQEVGRKTENVAAKTQVPKPKKESVVSNDVIEETASKLREQRKNKVKALAGAFETVIFLQEQK